MSAIPNEVEPWVNLARAQARSGQLEAADATYERAERRFGTPAFLLGHRVGFLLGTGRFEEALSAQRTLMAQRSDDEASRRNMVAVLAAVGDARLKDGDGVGACAIAEEMKALAPGVSMVAQRAARMCPR